MERGNGLADLTLVNKYFPVANYSYPRNENTNHGYYEPRTTPDRSSLGSDGTPPGLVDDKSDSDLSFSSSFESERNYEVMAAQLWDSFWEPPADDAKPRTASALPKKDYPFLARGQAARPRALVNTDKGLKTNDLSGAASWPLNGDAAQRARNRKPAATYSPFPKPMPLPPRAKPVSPSWQNSRPREPPKRPARPDTPLNLFSGMLYNNMPPASAEQKGMLDIPTPTVQRPSTAKEVQTPDRIVFSPVTLTTEVQRPTTSHETRRAASPVEPQRPATPPVPITPVCYRPTKPLDPPRDLRRPPTPPVPEGAPEICPIHGDPSTRSRYTTNSYLLHPAYMPEGSCCVEVPAMEPQSVFEDSDDEDGDGNIFRRFHKRSVSDLRRWRRSGESDTSHRGRSRTNTAPSSPDASKRRASVFNRMLGRRNS